jgi:broad specificity phosphatase PhoE
MSITCHQSERVILQRMQLVVIRHGETNMNKEGRLQGSKGPDLPLNETGRSDIAALRDTLILLPKMISTSPLLRARETADILNERFHLPIILAPELMERDFGTLSGKLRSEVASELLEDDLEGHYDYRPYGGESAEDVRTRVLRFLKTLPTEGDDPIILITHRGVIRILYDLFPNDALPEMILPSSKHFFDIRNLPEA